MDVSRLSQGQLIVGGGGILLIVSLFLNWSFGGSAFDLFSGMDIIMLVVGAVAVAYAALPAIGSAHSVPAQSSGVLLLLGVLVLGFVLGEDLEDPYAGVGAWLALIASAAIAVGAFEGIGRARSMTRGSARRRRDPSSTTVRSRDPASTTVGSRDPGSTTVGSRDPGSTRVGSRDPGSTRVGSRDPGSTSVRTRPRGAPSEPPPGPGSP
jgi:uncharacterized membrane protein YbhN (UPF0104 family)